MKKSFLSLGLIMAAMFTLTNCTEQIDAPVEPAKVPFEIIASTVETKTAAGDNLSTVWTEGDALNVFHVFAGNEGYQNDGKFELTGDNTFKGELSGTFEDEDCYNWYALYPYNKNVTTPANTGDKGYVTVGSGASASQIQIGNNSMSHIAGPNYPLAGVAEDVEYYAGEPLEINMSHLSSLIEFVVTNDTKEPLTVSNISFTATENIVGTYYIDFTDFENAVFTSSGDNYVSSVAKLNVNEAEPIEAGKSAKFYMAVKPFTALSGQKLTIMINDCEKEKILAKAITFSAGKIKTINCSYTTPESALAGIAGIKDAADEAGTAGGTFVADVEDAVVTFVSGNNAYIQDATAGILIFASGHGLEVGNVLNGRISGTVKIYNNLREITSFTSSATVTETEDIPVTTVTIADLNANQDKYENMRVKLVGVEVTADAKFSKDGASVAYYKKNKNAAGLKTYNLVDVVGYPGKYNDAFQFNVWEDAEVKGATQTTISGFSTEITVGVEASVPNKATASSGATVSYVSANNAVATVDEEGNITGVAVGSTTVTASVEAYNGYPAASVTCNVTVTADAPAEPVYLLQEDFSSLTTWSTTNVSSLEVNDKTWQSAGGKMYGQSGCLKFGSSTAAANVGVKLPNLTVNESTNVTLNFKAVSSDANYTLCVTVTNAGTVNTISPQSITKHTTAINNGASTSTELAAAFAANTAQFSVEIDGVTSESVITIIAKDNAKRWYIDDVEIIKN